MRLFLCFVIFILSPQKMLSQDENNSTYFKIEGDSIYKKEIDLGNSLLEKIGISKNGAAEHRPRPGLGLGRARGLIEIIICLAIFLVADRSSEK